MNLTKPEFKEIVSNEHELRSFLGEPSLLAGNKVITKLDSHCKTIIQHSPFLVISTSNSDGTCDASPRGDAPGFVYIVDEHHVIIPERPGNKRADSIHNILTNPHVGLIFMIPGMEETLRINGRAFIIRDQHWLEKMSAQHKVPHLGIVVEIEEIFMHCAKAFKRSHLWNPDSWPKRQDLPSMAEVLKDHVKKEELTVETINDTLKESYSKRLY
ncbi:PPOX class probable FMN-dependent enzyme [Bacillus mesophilus]|uniref:Pyridoxamine 5'-phosphate oxidase family protein n=1 Tax=Bacillus mesophilus TaxID=1808955 RepID=A0A6M0QA02_9BACI|nr:pyridoxamine 5'-phosphate oxidase family protein [Bacillus mesophilus]MBM7662086.1 PPOX class probable FMN-dependent enzyme [Bacillus mesophilus]NEY72559.1 pyridoxamine 5'-phosphate oxidase family protein [Bacillus mesophilus]